jgi:hypothetical protein
LPLVEISGRLRGWFATIERPHPRLMIRLACGIAFVSGVSSTTALANGAEFFLPAGKNTKVELGYVGTIRDRAGRPLDFVDVTVSARDGSITFPFSNDRPGHYRSPDIGLLLKEAVGSVDPSQLEITCFVTGFKRATRSLPRRSQGTFEVDFVMDEDGSGTGSLSIARSPRRNSSRSIPSIGIAVLLLTAAIGARTAARRSS